MGYPRHAGRYTANSNVPVDQSRHEIHRILARHRAKDIGYESTPTGSVLRFVLQGHPIRFAVPAPDPQAREFWFTPTGQQRSWEAAAEAHAANERQRWRALTQLIRAKIQAIEIGVLSFDSEFAPYRVTEVSTPDVPALVHSSN